MGSSVSLVAPSFDYKEGYAAFYREWKESGEDMVPWVIKRDPDDFKDMIRFLESNAAGENLPEGWVPDSTYWLADEKKDVIGVVNIRHRLTPRLFNNGGHIGYGIRPSARRLGYATKLLELSLAKANALGIERALVVCDEWNEASRKTILNNGGLADEDFIEEDGNVILRYWIDTKPEK
ncbi:GNAT family N-acetyltransferase [Indiicoccus explosivorum]|uniref:GNAT family N-acetyltransferase n=1 Tax=Indiicoccus explosivorum TaxID=1917864 RepID=UPI000B451940|nr:GNAT family N-acetyltransferase [Indiicoccus explosivorum]